MFENIKIVSSNIPQSIFHEMFIGLKMGGKGWKNMHANKFRTTN